jgi:hypothetical protein
MLATMLYLMYLFFWIGQVQFLIGNSKASFSKIEETDTRKFLQYLGIIIFITLFHQWLRFLGVEDFKKSPRFSLVNQAYCLIWLLDQDEILTEELEDPVLYWLKYHDDQRSKRP